MLSSNFRMSNRNKRIDQDSIAGEGRLTLDSLRSPSPTIPQNKKGRRKKSAPGGIEPEWKELAPSFRPGPHDVICARGRSAKDHEGNKRFLAMIEQMLERYGKTKGKFQKSMIVWEVVNEVRQKSPDGGFVKEFQGKWYEVGDYHAREKIGQAFRDRLHTKYRSSSRAKLLTKKLQAAAARSQEDEASNKEDPSHATEDLEPLRLTNEGASHFGSTNFAQRLREPASGKIEGQIGQSSLIDPLINSSDAAWQPIPLSSQTRRPTNVDYSGQSFNFQGLNQESTFQPDFSNFSSLRDNGMGLRQPGQAASMPFAMPGDYSSHGLPNTMQHGMMPQSNAPSSYLFLTQNQGTLMNQGMADNAMFPSAGPQNSSDMAAQSGMTGELTNPAFLPPAAFATNQRDFSSLISSTPYSQNTQPSMTTQNMFDMQHRLSLGFFRRQPGDDSFEPSQSNSKESQDHKFDF